MFLLPATRVSLESRAVAFRTKVDGWLVVVLVVALGASLVAAVAAMGSDPGEGWFALGIIGGTTLLIVAISLPTEYIITEDELIVRSGIVRTVIPFDAIQRVYPTRNPLAGPAWSLDRLAIDYRKRRGRALVLISPAKKGEFLAVLQERTGMNRAGDYDLVSSR